MSLSLAWPAPRWPGRLASAAVARFPHLAAAERNRLAPWLAIALGAGVLSYFCLSVEPPPAVQMLAPPSLLLAVWLGWRRPAAGWVAGLVAAFLLGLAAAAWHGGHQPPMPELPRTATIITGRIAAVELLPEGRRVTVEAPRLDGGEQLARALRFRLKADDPARPAPGDTITARVMLRAPAAPAYPGGWDFQRNAWFSGLGGSGFALGRAEVTPGEQGEPFFAALRSRLEARVTEAIPGPAGSIAAALITGGQSGIPAPEMLAMRDSGLAHLLSVSGLHIVIVMGLAYGALRFLAALIPWVALRLPGKPAAALGALAVGAAYMLLTGAQVPMQRSFAMACLGTLALMTGRRALSLRAWALAFAAVLLLQPAALLGPSFQMSFAAALALIAGWEWLRPRLPRAKQGSWQGRLLLALFGLVATSVLAGLATAPFGLHHFGRLQLYGVAANAIAVPLTSLIVMPAGMIAVALMPFGLEQLALTPMGWGVEAILLIARLVAAWPGATLALPPMPAAGLAVLSLGLLWLCLWGSRMRLAGVPLIVLGLASGALHRPPDVLVSADGRLISFRSDEGLALQKLNGASKLDRESWLRLYGLTEATSLPQAGEIGPMACTTGACTLESPAGRVVLLRGAPPAEACAGAVLVVSAEPVRGRCSAQVIDRFAVWRNGMHAAWLGPESVRVVNDRQARGARPWVPPPPIPRGRPTKEPPAPLDPGEDVVAERGARPAS